MLPKNSLKLSENKAPPPLLFASVGVCASLAFIKEGFYKKVIMII